MLGIGKKKKGRNNHRRVKRDIFEAVVPISLVDQAEAFTAPRGHMEMGGLLIGHVDDQGRNVCTVGIFPEQIEETPSYCEFDGKWIAMCAAAADFANTQIGSENTPNLRVIGWIHTHPGLDVFLSGTDIKTYKDNLNMTKDGRFVAVVVDPLEGINGVFLNPDKPHSFFSASGSIQMDGELKARYLAFLQRMEEIREVRGREALPFILCGDLRADHVSKGNTDDFVESYLKGIHSTRKDLKRTRKDLKSLAEDSEDKSYLIDQLEKLINRNEKKLTEIESSMEVLQKEMKSKILKMNARMKSREKDLVGAIEKLSESLEVKFAEIEMAIMASLIQEGSEGSLDTDAEKSATDATDLSLYFLALGVS